jgi:hypothetical protein
MIRPVEDRIMTNRRCPLRAASKEFRSTGRLRWNDGDLNEKETHSSSRVDFFRNR